MDETQLLIFWNQIDIFITHDFINLISKILYGIETTTAFIFDTKHDEFWIFIQIIPEFYNYFILDEEEVKNFLS
jgi:hypothetical protein